MNISQITAALTALTAATTPDTFIYELLLAYNLPKASVARLKNGNLNLSKIDHHIVWKKKLLFAAPPTTPAGELALTDELDAALDLHTQIEQLKASPAAKAHAPRFIIATDYTQLLAYDTKTHDSLDIAIADLAKHADFFLPWAGMEKAQAHTENAADVKAAANMAKLYDLITELNPSPDASTQPVAAEAHAHALNVFLSRLLFCFFAEDTGIFSPNQFTRAVDSHTQPDGSDLAAYIDTVFTVLNTAPRQRAQDLPAYLAAFEYVNGGLFKQPHPAPTFNRKSRDLLIDLGEQDWSEINPDIFGSMIQAVVMPSKRGDLGMHYTSVPNIMKVIGPLFLDELHAEFDAAHYEPRKLDALRERISRIKVFDPACGSGNFLITAYKKLCELEIAILNQRLALQKIARSDSMGGNSGSNTGGFALPQGDLIPKAQRTLAEGFQIDMGSRIELSQFYGIEIDDFAHEIATLSLWLAQHQMNVQFKQLFGSANPTLPLAPSGNITHGNACRVDWEAVCPKQAGDEIYILGNPPYLGGKLLNAEQKEDVFQVFKKSQLEKYNNIDYIGVWFYKAAIFLNENSKAAFVSTNSICQGTQVSDLWPSIFKEGIEIFFAHKEFHWENNAKHNAAVICSIIGLCHKYKFKKYIYEENIKNKVENINAYLLDAPNIFIKKRTLPISNLPLMNQGNIPLENGFLRFTEEEKNQIILKYPESNLLFRKTTGSDELINSLIRWCLWIVNNQAYLDLALSIPEIKKRILEVSKFRANGAQNSQACLDRPHQFCMTNEAKNSQIIIPIVSSERRKYIPINFIDKSFVVQNSALVIYDPEIYIFSLINSKIHLLWVKTFSGKLKSDYRYSVGVCWYSFPFPDLLAVNKAELEQCAYRILETRERYSEKTLAQLYDPKGMPADLRAAHHENDLAVERCYRSKLFTSDEERLAYLFSEYERMVGEENAQLDLLADDKKASKVKKPRKSKTT